MHPVLETILTRRSIRKFKADPVPREAVEQIVTAGLYAPSSRNRQPWHLTVVAGLERIERITDELREAVARMPDNPYKAFVGSPGYTVNYHAPLFIMVSAHPEASTMPLADCSTVLQNMFLAARALGIGSCWINQLGSACPDPGFRAFLTGYGVPDGNHIHGCGAFGYPAGNWPAAPERKGHAVTYLD